MIALEPLEPEDLELLYTIENDREMWSVSSSNVPYSRYALRDYIANQQYDIFADKQLRMVIRIPATPPCTKEQPIPTSRAIGLIDLFNFSPEHSRAELGLAILKSEQGKGYATAALREMLSYARDILHIHQIYCIVPADNLASLAMLRKVGFTNEVTLKDWMQTSMGWQDAISLQYIFSTTSPRNACSS